MYEAQTWVCLQITPIGLQAITTRGKKFCVRHYGVTCDQRPATRDSLTAIKNKTAEPNHIKFTYITTHATHYYYTCTVDLQLIKLRSRSKVKVTLIKIF